MNRSRRRFAALLLAAPLAASGCGEGKPSVATDTKTEATVKGTVTLNGKPAANGEIVFNPANYLRKDVLPRTAPIKDGAYEIKTLTGANLVTLRGKAIVKAYPLAEKARLEFDVHSGENTFPIVLPK